VFYVSHEQPREKTGLRRSPIVEGELEGSGGLRMYVIQEHHASHLHWDLRLEMDGVLRSWAVPKKPPEAVGVRRLAVEVEDHPLEYASFEGKIPEGEYGAGLVTIWDRGTYDAVKVTENKIVFTIRGERLKGNHCLLRTRFGGATKNWLFFKMKS
jgi:DNA ligase D-like protein (predicted 3'-phosphoesterase)